MKKKKRKNRVSDFLKMILISSAVVCLIVFVIFCISRGIEKKSFAEIFKIGDSGDDKEIVKDPFLLSDAIQEQYLTINDYSRPGTKLKKVKGIVVHYVGNPGTTAMQNRNYFEGLKDSHYTSASSHYIIGLEGEIIQCVPLEEISYASNQRNVDTISIECCHPDESGAFRRATYDSLVKLTAALCRTYDLDPSTDVIRHYDVTGKLCPKYYVDNPGAWEVFKKDVQDMLEKEEETSQE